MTVLLLGHVDAHSGVVGEVGAFGASTVVAGGRFTFGAISFEPIQIRLFVRLWVSAITVGELNEATKKRDAEDQSRACKLMSLVYLW